MKGFFIQGKRRRAERDFPGAEVILQQLKDKPARRRVGLLSKGPPARSHTDVLDSTSGEKIGSVTSGCPSPSLGSGANVAMAYLPAGMAKVGSRVTLSVRKAKVEAEVVKMPFVKANYYVVGQ